jgi:LDH2 family malate/lactate/ureidoglycolate dehydrogenase
MAGTRVPAELVREQITSILDAWGMPPEAVAITAQAMVETDLWGVDSHGVSMLAMYETMKREGRLNVDARPHVVERAGVFARLDGDAGLGHPVAHMGMQLAVDIALESGVAAVTAFNSHHFGAAGVYAKMASDRGCIGFVTSTARTVAVLPTFGAEPVLGTNPIAFAAPGERERPFLLDFATSAVALNKVKVYDFHGKPLPAGWVADGDGRAVTDAKAALSVCREQGLGGLNPVGGTRELGSHKGYGLGAMAQILAGALAGGSFSPVRDRTLETHAPYNIGHFFLALSPGLRGAARVAPGGHGAARAGGRRPGSDEPRAASRAGDPDPGRARGERSGDRRARRRAVPAALSFARAKGIAPISRVDRSQLDHPALRPAR